MCLVPELSEQWGDQRRQRVSLPGPSLDHPAPKRCLEKAFLVDGGVYKKPSKN